MLIDFQDNQKRSDYGASDSFYRKFLGSACLFSDSGLSKLYLYFFRWNNPASSFYGTDFSMDHTSLQYLQYNQFDLVKLDGNLVKSLLGVI